MGNFLSANKTLAVFLVVALSIPLLGSKKNDLPEQDWLRHIAVYGDFRKAEREKAEKRVSLKVWENFAEYQQKLPQAARNPALQGRDRLEWEYDEVWVSPREDYVKLGKGTRQKKPDLVKLYWKEGRVQALTVERFFSGELTSWRRLPEPGYKVVALFDRELILKEMMAQAARDQAFQELTPGQHLEEAKRALGEGNPRAKELRERTYGRVIEARRHLEAIPKKTAEYEEAKELLKEVAWREKDLKKQHEAMREAARGEMSKRRQAMAAEIDRDFLSKGFDVKIEVSGTDNTTLTLDCVLFSRPLVHALVDKGDLVQNFKDAGVQKVIFTNKTVKYSWEIDLQD